MIQTIVFVKYDSGLNFDIEPNVIIKPMGSDISSVKKNSLQFSTKLADNSLVISKNVIPLPRYLDLTTKTCLFCI